MKIHNGFKDLGTINNPVVTTGSFDGVHVGHKVILNRLKVLAREVEGESVVITFHPHPRKVLYPDTLGKELKLISSQREKIKLLEEAGIDHVIIVEFNIRFSKISSKDFVNKLLLKKLGARIIIVGFNHFFGHNREGNFQYLHDLAVKKGFIVEEIPEQDIQNESVSSTKIRKALLEGNIQRANAYLDNRYMIIGELMPNTCAPIQGFLPFCIDIREEEKLTPPPGIYAITVAFEGFSSNGFVYIVHNEKFKFNTAVLLHTFQNAFSLFGKEVKITFHKKIRDDRPFESVDLLLRQLEQDKREVEDLIF